MARKAAAHPQISHPPLPEVDDDDKDDEDEASEAARREDNILVADVMVVEFS